MAKKKEIYLERARAYREINNRYSDVDVDSLEIREIKNLIRLVYKPNTIRGKRLEEIPSKQLYCIARTMAETSKKFCNENKENALERKILKNLESLEGIFDENLREKFIKKINSQIKNLDGKEYLILEYNCIIDRLEQLKH